MSGPITAGHLMPPASPVTIDLAAHDYIQEEYFASGTATSYQAETPLDSSGHWSVRPRTTAPFSTRVVVHRPSSPARFNGTVLVEWFNVTGGLEANPDWAYLNPAIVRDGYAYVGVSAQALGIHGGPGILDSPAMPSSGGLTAAQPDRYGSLRHPGDEFSFDIYAQIGHALRSGTGAAVLGDLHPDRVLAVGESQSAFYLTTFVNAVQPLSRPYDGFFIHSRGGPAAPLSGASIRSDGGPPGVRIRDDVSEPVFIFETETDLGDRLNFGPARQPDTDRIRTWEVAGTAHADSYLLGAVAELMGCTTRINEGPQHAVVQAALTAFHRWVMDGTTPPEGAPIQLTAPRTVARADSGIALGGIRTPAVDVPTSTLSGDPPPGCNEMCSLFGSTVPFDGEDLVRLYGNREQFLARFTESLRTAIADGFILAADQDELLATAQAVSFP
jgi:hypothetical protein